LSQAVEKSFIDGNPLHHLPSASDVNVPPNDPHVSLIFVVDGSTFTSMAPQLRHNVFRQRHILISKSNALPCLTFNEHGLEELGDLLEPILIHGQSNTPLKNLMLIDAYQGAQLEDA
jgi:hypothetical protein